MLRSIDHCLYKKEEANSLDFGEFRQIILYFGLSTWTHFEYRITSSTLIYILFRFFGFIICIPFSIRKNIYRKCWQRWVVFNELGDLHYLLVEFSIKFPAIYVNINKIYRKLKKLPKTSLITVYPTFLCYSMLFLVYPFIHLDVCLFVCLSVRSY